MRPIHPNRLLVLAVPLAVLVGACSSGSSPATSPAGSVAGVTASPAGSMASGGQITVSSNATVGSFLVGPNGMTLYILKKDSPNTSTCTGQCAGIWPPLSASGGQAPTAGPGVTGTIATITRSDGGTQVTYNGMPLYNYSKDTAAGQVNGQGVGGVWFAATPTGTPGGAGASMAPSPSSSSGGGYTY